MSSLPLSIIICTYNRAVVLGIVLDFLSRQSRPFYQLEIVVVDNNSTDNTKSVIQTLAKNDSRIKYLLEPMQGLSHARNKGARLAKSDWLLYLDDDAKLNQENIERVLDTIKSHDFKMFTGVWKAWYLTQPPKWLPHSTGNYILKGSKEIREIENDYVTGLIMIINKQKLLEIGGFPSNLGMTGDKVAYGEETYVEEEFKKRGWKVGINPHIVIDHLVGEHKYRLAWHLSSAKAKGASNIQIFESKPILIRIINLFMGTGRAFFKSLMFFVIKRDFYVQNFVIDVLSPLMYFIGSLSSSQPKD